MLEHRDELEMEGIDEINEALGIDALKDVLSLTIYSGARDNAALDVGVHENEVHVGAATDSANNAVAVLVMTAAADGVIERFKQDESYAEIHKDGLVLHSFVDHESDQRHNVYIQQGARANERLLVAGPDIDLVARAVQVARGDAASLKDGAAPLAAATPSAGSFVFATGVEIDGMDDENPASQILDKSKQVTFDLGEQEGSAFASLAVAAKTQEDATNISQILQGLVALGRMVFQNEPHAADAMSLLQAVRFDARDQVIVASLKYPSDKACEMLVHAASHHDHVHEVHDHLRNHFHSDDDAGDDGDDDDESEDAENSHSHPHPH